MRYRGQIEDFNKNVYLYENHLRQLKEPIQDADPGLIEGKCTAEGTQRFRERAAKRLGIPAKNFKKTYPLPVGESAIQIELSTVGYGTFIGKPDDEDDFDSYNAAKLLIRSGAINFIDTAQNFRCQKAERSMGSVLKTLNHQVYGEFRDSRGDPYRITRDELFVTTKSGYVPDDSDNGVSA